MRQKSYAEFNKHMGKTGMKIYTVGNTQKQNEILKKRTKNLEKLWVKRFGTGSKLSITSM